MRRCECRRGCSCERTPRIATVVVERDGVPTRVCSWCELTGDRTLRYINTDTETHRRPLTAAQILAVAGTVSAVIGTVGGALRSPLIIGVASFVMLLGNIAAYLVDRNKPR